MALHTEACCSWATSWGLREEGLLGTLRSPLWSIFHTFHTQGHQPWLSAWAQDGLCCLTLPGEGEAGGEGDLALVPWLLAVTLAAGARAGQLSQH